MLKDLIAGLNDTMTTQNLLYCGRSAWMVVLPFVTSENEAHRR